MNILTFPNYTPERFAALVKALDAKGLHLEGTVGDVKEFGANVSYMYDGKILTLLVRSAPHFHSMDGFVASLEKVVTSTDS